MRKFAVTVAALALAGCTSGTPSTAPGSSSTSAPSGTQPSSTAPSAPSTTLSSPTGPVQPPQTSAEPLPGGPTALPPERVDGGTLSDLHKKDVSTSADGRTLRVTGLAGGCKRASAEVAAQAADQVRITLVTTYYPPAGGACTQEFFDVPLNVTLDAPLGDRRVVLESREDTA